MKENIVARVCSFMNHISNITKQNRLTKSLVFLLLTLCSPLSFAQDYVWAPDFPVGSSIPVLDAPDQNGNTQNLLSLSSKNGILLVFNRSFDWCPYCKAQLKSLVEVSAQFEALGLSLVTITYDSVDTLKLVEEDLGLGFTLLHDEEIKHINAFGIRNKDYAPGEFGYGIPEPGIMLISPDGVIKYKFSEENYRIRPDWSGVLDAARNM